MSVSDYLRRIAHRWRAVAVVTLLLVGAAAAVTFTTPKVYESKATVYVSSADSEKDMGNVLAAGVYAQQKVLSYASVATSERMAQTVIADLGLDETPKELAQRIRAEVRFGTVLVDLTVQGSTARDAQAVAESVVAHYNFVLESVDNPNGKGLPVQVSVLSPPTLPTTAASPNVALNLLAALFAGLLLGVAVAALRDLLDNTVKGAGELAGQDLALLGQLPIRNRKADHIISQRDRTALAESLRELRVNLQFASVDNPPRTIMVTSSSPSEGKSFVSANLAAAYALAGLDVVLVDADLRRPVLADRFGLERAVGLTTVLVGKIGLELALQETSLPNLRVLSSGMLPPNPAELLGSDAMGELLGKLAASGEIVIIDSPPTRVFADARSLARFTDGVILVAQSGVTKTHYLAEAARGLSDLGTAVLGVVLNRSKQADQSVYDYYTDKRHSSKPA